MPPPIRNILLLTDSLPGCTNSTAPMVESLSIELQRHGYGTNVVGIGSETHVPSVPFSVYQSGLKSRYLMLRAINEATACLKLYLWVKRGIEGGVLPRPDLCIVFAPSIFLGMTNVLLRRRYGCRSYLVQRDILPDWMVESGKLRRNNPAASLLRALKHLTLLHVDVIAVECVENYRFIPSEFHNKLRTLPNWRTYGPDTTFECPLPSTLNMIYGGRMGPVQGFDCFLRAALAVDDLAGALDIYCDERGQAELNRSLQARSSASATFRINVKPMLAERDFIRHASNYSLGIVTLSPEMKTHNIPGKLLGYMAAGIPVFAVGPADAALRRVIEELEIGMYVDGSSPSSVQRELHSLARDPSRLASMRANVVARRHTFDVRDIAKAVLSDILDGVPDVATTQ